MPSSDLPPDTGNPVALQPHRRNYFIRHWRGELSLPVSYFVNGLLLTVIFLAIVRLLQPALEMSLGPLTGLAFIGGIWGLGGLLTIWQLVGLWRAAGAHKARTGRAFWAGVARVLVVVGAIGGVWRCATVGVPLVGEYVKIALGDTTMGTFELRVRNDGREIEYSGAIVHGAAEALEKLLRQTPQARVIHLHSMGGRTTEGRRMMNVIRQAGIDTYVPLQCLSACTIVFLGGKNRYMQEKAELGFHAGSIRGVSDADLVRENRRIVDHVVEMGVDRAFATRAYLTQGSAIWYPTSQELIAARFVTAVSQGQFALPSTKFSRQHFSDLLKEIPLYAAIARHEPDLFARLIDINMEAASRGIPESELVARMQVHMVPLVTKYLPYASDEALVLFLGLYIENMRLVTAKRGAIACHAHVMDDGAEKFDPKPYLDKAQLEKYLRMAELVIITGGDKAGTPLPLAKIEPVFDQLWDRILRKHGADAVQGIAAMQEGRFDKNRTCTLAEMLYAAMLDFPPAQAAAMLRYLLTQT